MPWRFLRPQASRGLIAAALLACASPDSAEESAARDSLVPVPPYSEATLPPESPPSAGVPGPAARVERPATKRAIVMIEGVPDTLELRLVESPDDFPLQFSTYVPADMDVQTERVNGARSLEVVANFGGLPNERAYIQMFFYGPGTTMALARTSVSGFVSGLNPEIDRAREVEPHPWAHEQTTFSYPQDGWRFVGSIALARRGQTVFHYIQHYPAEYADGMAPRISTILREWLWEDGTRLIGGS